MKLVKGPILIPESDEVSEEANSLSLLMSFTSLHFVPVLTPEGMHFKALPNPFNFNSDRKVTSKIVY
jgi:hypothetical protein